MPHGDVRFTTEQRLAILERESVVLHDTAKLLHRMLKEQRELINDYIVKMVTAPAASDVQTSAFRPQKP